MTRLDPQPRTDVAPEGWCLLCSTEKGKVYHKNRKPRTQ